MPLPPRPVTTLTLSIGSASTQARLGCFEYTPCHREAIVQSGIAITSRNSRRIRSSISGLSKASTSASYSCESPSTTPPSSCCEAITWMPRRSSSGLVAAIRCRSVANDGQPSKLR